MFGSFLKNLKILHIDTAKQEVIRSIGNIIGDVNRNPNVPPLLTNNLQFPSDGIMGGGGQKLGKEKQVVDQRRQSLQQLLGFQSNNNPAAAVTAATATAGGGAGGTSSSITSETQNFLRPQPKPFALGSSHTTHHSRPSFGGGGASTGGGGMVGGGGVNSRSYDNLHASRTKTVSQLNFGATSLRHPPLLLAKKELASDSKQQALPNTGMTSRTQSVYFGSQRTDDKLVQVFFLIVGRFRFDF